jgi:hypothetical protein
MLTLHPRWFWSLGGISVIKAESNVSTKGVRPGTQAFALTIDERVKGVKEQSPYPDDTSLLGLSETDESVEDWDHEAFRLPGACPARYHE